MKFYTGICTGLAPCYGVCSVKPSVYAGGRWRLRTSDPSSVNASDGCSMEGLPIREDSLARYKSAANDCNLHRDYTGDYRPGLTHTPAAYPCKARVWSASFRAAASSVTIAAAHSAMMLSRGSSSARAGAAGSAPVEAPAAMAAWSLRRLSAAARSAAARRVFSTW